MDNQKSGFLASGGLTKALIAAAIMVAVFLLVLTLKEMKSYKYVGAGIGATNTINVSGKGEAFAAPDIATFSFSVTKEAGVVKTAQDQVTNVTNAILADLKKSGVADKDIRTTSYNIYPRYEYQNQTTYPFNPGKRVLAGYDVSQTIEVKVRQIDQAGQLISSIGELGATDISGLTFSVDKEEQVIAEARNKAIEDAKTKANVLAGQLGVHLVRIVNFSEQGNYPQPIYNMAYSAGAMDQAKALPAAMPTGENKFQSNVSITYEIQ